jgi:hypothetical protein
LVVGRWGGECGKILRKEPWEFSRPFHSEEAVQEPLIGVPGKTGHGDRKLRDTPSPWDWANQRASAISLCGSEVRGSGKLQ